MEREKYSKIILFQVLMQVKVLGGTTFQILGSHPSAYLGGPSNPKGTTPRTFSFT
jgi:hypothetical protein